MADDIVKICTIAAEKILSYPNQTRIRVISHYDADGTSAAAIISKALYRADYNFHVSLMRNPFDKGLERVSKEENELIIFCDMGSGQIETIEKMKCDSIIIDHHQYIKSKTTKNVFQINANLCGINGNYEACGATLTSIVARLMDERNIDLFGLAMVGATGDKQYIGDFRGLNKKILDQAVKSGILKEEMGIKLYGESINDSLYHSIDPFYKGLSGNKKKIKNIFEKIGIEYQDKLDDLDKEKQKKIHSLLLLNLLNNGCEQNIIDTVIRPRYWSDALGCELERLADLFDACGKGGNRGLGLSAAIGDKKSFEKAVGLEKEYREKILNELLKLEKEGIKERKGFRYFYSIDSSLGGVIGGIASNFIFDRKKPLISMVKNDDEIHISARGNQHLVKKGLNLGLAMKEAAKKLDGHGGGHAIAAGATISIKKEKDFLTLVDEIVSSQIKV